MKVTENFDMQNYADNVIMTNSDVVYDDQCEWKTCDKFTVGDGVSSCDGSYGINTFTGTTIPFTSWGPAPPEEPFNLSVDDDMLTGIIGYVKMMMDDPVVDGLLNEDQLIFAVTTAAEHINAANLKIKDKSKGIMLLKEGAYIFALRILAHASDYSYLKNHTELLKNWKDDLK